MCAAQGWVSGVGRYSGVDIRNFGARGKLSERGPETSPLRNVDAKLSNGGPCRPPRLLSLISTPGNIPLTSRKVLEPPLKKNPRQRIIASVAANLRSVWYWSSRHVLCFGCSCNLHDGSEGNGFGCCLKTEDTFLECRNVDNALSFFSFAVCPALISQVFRVIVT